MFKALLSKRTHIAAKLSNKIILNNEDIGELIAGENSIVTGKKYSFTTQSGFFLFGSDKLKISTSEDGTGAVSNAFGATVNIENGNPVETTYYIEIAGAETQTDENSADTEGSETATTTEEEGSETTTVHLWEYSYTTSDEKNTVENYAILTAEETTLKASRYYKKENEGETTKYVNYMIYNPNKATIAFTTQENIKLYLQNKGVEDDTEIKDGDEIEKGTLFLKNLDEGEATEGDYKVAGIEFTITEKAVESGKIELPGKIIKIVENSIYSTDTPGVLTSSISDFSKESTTGDTTDEGGNNENEEDKDKDEEAKGNDNEKEEEKDNKDKDEKENTDDGSKKVDDDKDSLGGGAIAGITVGCVAAVAIIGFCVYWFVFRKKAPVSAPEP